MTNREAMKLALEALEQSVSAMRGLYGGWRCTTALKESDKAITALRQALEQPSDIEAAVKKENEACAEIAYSMAYSEDEAEEIAKAIRARVK